MGQDCLLPAQVIRLSPRVALFCQSLYCSIPLSSPSFFKLPFSLFSLPPFLLLPFPARAFGETRCHSLHSNFFRSHPAPQSDLILFIHRHPAQNLGLMAFPAWDPGAGPLDEAGRHLDTHGFPQPFWTHLVGSLPRSS